MTKFKLVFNRKKHLNHRGKAPIEICVYHNRKRLYQSTGIFIHENEWDYKNDRIHKRHPEYESLNTQITLRKNALTNLQNTAIAKGKSFTLESIRQDKSRLKTGSIIEFVKHELKQDRSLTPKTKQSHNNTLNWLTEFSDNKGVCFVEIDFHFVDRFLNFLRQNKLAQNTVHKHHKNLKKYIEVAIKKGYYDLKNPCKDLPQKYEYKKKEVLTAYSTQSDPSILSQIDPPKLSARFSVSAG